MNKRPLPAAGLGLPAKPYTPPGNPGPAPPLPSGPPPPQPAYPPQQDPSAAHAAAWAAYYQVSLCSGRKPYASKPQPTHPLTFAFSRKVLRPEQRILQQLNRNNNNLILSIRLLRHLRRQTRTRITDTVLELNIPHTPHVNLNNP